MSAGIPRTDTAIAERQWEMQPSGRESEEWAAQRKLVNLYQLVRVFRNDCGTLERGEGHLASGCDSHFIFRSCYSALRRLKHLEPSLFTWISYLSPIAWKDIISCAIHTWCSYTFPALMARATKMLSAATRGCRLWAVVIDGRMLPPLLMALGTCFKLPK